MTNPIIPLLRYRFSKELAMEMLGGALIQGATIGVDTAAGSQMELSWSGAYAGVLLSYELAGLELGVGPALQSVHWRVDDHNWPYNASTFYESSFHSKTAGLIGDVSWRLRLVGGLHADVHGESRWFARLDVRGSPRFPAVNVRNNSSYFGLGLGWAF